MPTPDLYTDGPEDIPWAEGPEDDDARDELIADSLFADQFIARVAVHEAALADADYAGRL
jgi:hypothetical protein